MRLAIIGLGSIGSRHLRNAKALGVDCYVADISRSREWDAVQAGAKLFTNPRNTPVDAVMVCTPWDQHLDTVKKCVELRLPVFCEKPLGSLDQIEEWRQVVKDAEGLVTQVGYQCRFNEKYLAMRVLRPKPDAGYFMAVCDMSKWPGQSYGPMLLEMSHEIDLALASGAPALVRGVSNGYTRSGGSISAWFDEDGAWGVQVRNDAPDYERHWMLSTGDDEVSVTFNSPAELGDQMYVEELAHFLLCVQAVPAGRPSLCKVPLSDGLRVLEVVKQIEEKTKCAKQ